MFERSTDFDAGSDKSVYPLLYASLAAVGNVEHEGLRVWGS
jgi:hypothetical protein